MFLTSSLIGSRASSVTGPINDTTSLLNKSAGTCRRSHHIVTYGP